MAASEVALSFSHQDLAGDDQLLLERAVLGRRFRHNSFLAAWR
jgi:hypothetical protein